MATLKVYDLSSAGSYLIVESRVQGYSDGYLGSFSFVLRAVGELYVPEPVSSEFSALLRKAIYSSLFDGLGLGDLQPDTFRSAELRYVPVDRPDLSSFFDFSFASFPSRSRSYQEPSGGEMVAKYHVVRISAESLVASFLLVDEPVQGDGVISQIYFPLRSRCLDSSLKFYE